MPAKLLARNGGTGATATAVSWACAATGGIRELQQTRRRPLSMRGGQIHGARQQQSHSGIGRAGRNELGGNVKPNPGGVD
jgi:hypothetical protein